MECVHRESSSDATLVDNVPNSFDEADRLKKCFEDFGNCQANIVKMLPCGHKEIECGIHPKDAYCAIQVEKPLENCHHFVTVDCSSSTKEYKCTKICDQPLCVNGHPCRKRCWESCGTCDVPSEYQLACGHKALIECGKNPQKSKCKKLQLKILPECGHQIEIECGNKLEDAFCPFLCEIRLDCGHQCTRHCHTKEDPDHINYKCEKMCVKNKIGCKKDHRCSKKCHEECDPCRIKEVRTLQCGHKFITECGIDENDDVCKEMLVKTVPECGHSLQLACSDATVPNQKMCNQPCENLLFCGHLCRESCSDKCSALNCQELVEISSSKGLCGHPILKPCNQSGKAVSEIEKVQLLQSCTESCGELLACEHRCKGQCGSCFNGRLHKSCEEKCGRTLICGHSCKVNCATSCPPCQERCQYRCEHSRCNKNCSDPCANCIEDCGWSCKHFKCTKKCYEPCDRPRCNEPCEELLPCGHLCVGLCGEECPPLCRICDREELVEFILYGNEEEEDARFVYLKDCGHTIEVEGLDHWMDTNIKREILMKCCPRCKTLIQKSYRYGDVIKRNLADIELVKKMMLPDPTSISKISQLIPTISRLKMLNSDLKASLDHHEIIELIEKHLKNMQKTLKPIKRKMILTLNSEQRFLMEVQVDIIEKFLIMMKNTHSKPSESSNFTTSEILMKPALLKDILDRSKIILESLFSRTRSSHEEHVAFTDEIRRLDLIRAFFTLRSAPHPVNYHPEDRELDKKLLRTVNKFSSQEEFEVKRILELLSRKLGTGLGISDGERKDIVRAIGLSKGHWYKCPNDHIYVIGESGVAIQKSICPHCGAAIGGQNYRLQSGNQVASEMDGAIDY